MSNNIIKRKGNSLYLGASTLNRPYKSVSNVPTYGFGDFKNTVSDAWSQLKGLDWNSDSSIMELLGNATKSSDAVGKAMNSIGKLAGKASGAFSTATNAIDAFKYGSQLNDMSELEGQISDARGFSSNAGTLDQLQNDALSLQHFNSVDGNDILAHNGWQTAGHTLKDMGKTFLTAKGGIFSKLGQTAAVGLAGLAGGIKGKLNADLNADLYDIQMADADLAQKSNIGLTNDWINNNNYDNYVRNMGLMAYGGLLPINRQFAYGGSIKHSGDFSNGMTFINEGGVHETNPLEGVPVGTAPDGMPNLVEEGEVIYDGYVYSNRLSASEKELVDGLLDKKYKNMTFAKIAEELNKGSDERPLDDISTRTLRANLARLRTIQEKQKQEKAEKEAKKQFESLPKEQQIALQNNAEQQAMQSQVPQEQVPQQDMDLAMPYAYGGHLFSGEGSDTNFLAKLGDDYTEEELAALDAEYQKPLDKAYATWQKDFYKANPWAAPKTTVPNNTDYELLPTWMRYAPVFGGAYSVANDLFGNRPDYTAANRIESTAKGLRDVGFSPVGQYMEFNPVDRNYVLNAQQNNAAAARRAVTGANRGMINAALLGLGLNQDEAVGDALLKMDQSNAQQRAQALEFNRGTDTFNGEGSMKAQMANAENAARRASILSEAAKMRDTERLRNVESRSLNLTNLFDNLGAIGKENASFNMVNSNRSLYYGVRPSGEMYYKPAYYSASPEERAIIDSIIGSQNLTTKIK